MKIGLDNRITELVNNVALRIRTLLKVIEIETPLIKWVINNYKSINLARKADWW